MHDDQRGAELEEDLPSRVLHANLFLSFFTREKRTIAPFEAIVIAPLSSPIGKTRAKRMSMQ